MAGKTANPGYVTLSGTNVNNTYVQLRAATGNAIYIVGIVIRWNTVVATGALCNVTIGTGGAGSETTVSIVAMAVDDVSGGGQEYAYLPIYIPVAASTRIAVKTDISAALDVGIVTIDQANVTHIL